MYPLLAQRISSDEYALDSIVGDDGGRRTHKFLVSEEDEDRSGLLWRGSFASGACRLLFGNCRLYLLTEPASRTRWQPPGCSEEGQYRCSSHPFYIGVGMPRVSVPLCVHQYNNRDYWSR